VIDRVVQPLGVRTFAFDPDKGFILNGKPTSLHGVSRHQDRQDQGWAISPEEHAEDMKFVVEIGANTVRQAHYQHAQEWSDAADQSRHGGLGGTPLHSSIFADPRSTDGCLG